jgi:hypothetical protein
MSESLLTIWEQVRRVPKDAQKEIKGGRLAGMTDVNPVWRLKTLTGIFGPCGVGWKYEVTGKHMETGANNEIAAFVDINLYIKHAGEWSAPIPGTGGSMFVAKERNGMHTSDECYKMALTDAISVACKSLGVAADVYWSADKSKYEQTSQPAPSAPSSGVQPGKITTDQYRILQEACLGADGKPDSGSVSRLKDILKKHGYETAKDIEQKDYDVIKSEFVDYGLPFDV